MIKHCAKEVSSNEVDLLLKELKECNAKISTISCSNGKFLVIYNIEVDEDETK